MIDGCGFFEETEVVRIFFIPILLSLLGLEVIGEEESVAPEIPPPLMEYMGREVARTMHWQGGAWLIRNRREREESAVEMREALELKPGMVVCDMGCGNGYHTLPMAEMVGEEGLVYAVDVQPEMITMLLERAAGRGFDNIKSIINEFHDPKLPENTFDQILMVDVYHEFSHPVEMLAGIRAALKEDGEVVLVEYRAEDETVPIKPEHKMTKEQVEKELNANGFRLSRSYDSLPWQHLMAFKRDDAPNIDDDETKTHSDPADPADPGDLTEPSAE